MSATIPDDIMTAAREALRCIDGELMPMTYLAAEKCVARALLSERESATKAERERCAKIAKIHGHHALWPVIGICEYNEISVHDGFGNKLSSRIAAAIRKGDGE